MTLHKEHIKKYILISIGIVIYRILLDISYDQVVSVLFDYQNFFNRPSSISKIISWIFLLSLMPQIIRIVDRKSLSDNILTILIIVSLVPTTTMIAFDSNYSPQYIFLMYVYWLLLLSAQLFFPVILIKKNENSNSPIWYKLITVTLVATVVFVSWKYTGFRFHFGLMDVYDLRSEAREYQVPLIIGYLSTFSDNLLPILLVYYLCRRHYIIASIIGIVILLNFGITATKQILFLLFLAIIGFFFVKSLKATKYFLPFFIGLLGVCIIEFKVFSSYVVSILSIYRVMFIPAKLHYVYFDFFSNNEPDYFRQSLLKWLLESPYKENIGFILGDHDIGDPTARANNGLFTDAFLNFGPIGVFFFPFILVTIVKFLEGATKGLDERLFFIITVSVSFVLVGIPFSTALLSSGILIMILFLSLLPRKAVNV